MSQYDKQYYWKNRDKKLKAHAVWARTLKGQYSASKSKAKYSGLDWDLSLEDYSNLRNNTCYYCGNKLPETSRGLDRLDNSKGYIKGNVVPCCYGCNNLKSDVLSEKETLEVIKLLKQLRNKENIWE